jgi:hypothetical protein
MCGIHAKPGPAPDHDAIAFVDDAPAVAPAPQACAGSRRRRIWELDSRAHCPIIGVCLPIATLRRVVNKVFHGRNIDKEYELHSGAVGECRKKTALAQGIQRELEQRYTLSLRQASRLRSTDELADWWNATSQTDLGAALWTTLTHPRCSPELAQRALGEAHMLQHQAGAAVRADQHRLTALLDENATLSQALGRAQSRNSQISLMHATQTDRQLRQILQLQAALAQQDARFGELAKRLDALTAGTPDLENRVALAHQLQQQAERIEVLERSLVRTQQESERRARLIDAQARELKQRETPAHTAKMVAQSAPVKRLDDCAVLCVGGRTASVPLYRHIIEGTGGRFLHHDGGEEESAAKLDATLAAADMVICQTACISHDSYWRVKDYCKRTGKQCVFVENPGTACLKRALTEFQTARAV